MTTVLTNEVGFLHIRVDVVARAVIVDELGVTARAECPKIGNCSGYPRPAPAGIVEGVLNVARVWRGVLLPERQEETDDRRKAKKYKG